jgi:hypothetical protein
MSVRGKHEAGGDGGANTIKVLISRGRNERFRHGGGHQALSSCPLLLKRTRATARRGLRGHLRGQRRHVPLAEGDTWNIDRPSARAFSASDGGGGGNQRPRPVPQAPEPWHGWQNVENTTPPATAPSPDCQFLPCRAASRRRAVAGRMGADRLAAGCCGVLPSGSGATGRCAATCDHPGGTVVPFRVLPPQPQVTAAGRQNASSKLRTSASLSLPSTRLQRRPRWCGSNILRTSATSNCASVSSRTRANSSFVTRG